MFDQDPGALLWISSDGVASHTGFFLRELILHPSPQTPHSSTKDNIPFQSLANHIVLSKFWKDVLDRRVIW